MATFSVSIPWPRYKSINQTLLCSSFFPLFIKLDFHRHFVCLHIPPLIMLVTTSTKTNVFTDRNGAGIRNSSSLQTIAWLHPLATQQQARGCQQAASGIALPAAAPTSFLAPRKPQSSKGQGHSTPLGSRALHGRLCQPCISLHPLCMQPVHIQVHVAVTHICFLHVSGLEMAERQLQLFYGLFSYNFGKRRKVWVCFHFINFLPLPGLKTLMVPLILPSAFLRHMIIFAASGFSWWRPGVFCKVSGSSLWLAVCSVRGLPAFPTQPPQT